MILHAPVLERLVEAFRRLPGVGKRSAERMALHVLAAPADLAEGLAAALTDARGRIRHCSLCGNLTENDPCDVCTNPRRDGTIICVVEQPGGAMAIERGGMWNGHYHVLHGVLNPLEGIGPDELHVDRLLRRLEGGDVREVVIATNATAEGEATALYLSRVVARMGVAVSRIAHGVPMGSGLEFADDATLTHAMRGRTRLGDAPPPDSGG